MKNTRHMGYKENPEMAAMTDYFIQHENKIKLLHKKFQQDTGEKIDLIEFYFFVYNNAPELIFNPQNN